MSRSSPADVPVDGAALSGMLPAEPLFGGAPHHYFTDDSPRDEDEVPAAGLYPRKQEAYAEETHPGQLPSSAPSEEYWDREAAARGAEILAQSSASPFSESAAPPVHDDPPRPRTLSSASPLCRRPIAKRSLKSLS